MDDASPGRRADDVEPDPDAIAALRARLPDELAHLPLTSAAEFRREAWKAWHVRPTANGWYHPRIGFRGLGAVVTGGLAAGGASMLLTGRSSSTSALEMVVTLTILVVATVLLTWSKWSSNRAARRLEQRNAVLSDVSDRLDREVEAGRIPLTPPGWEGRVSAPL